MRERIYLMSPGRTRRWSLARIGGCSDLEMSWTWPGGSDEASWRMDLPPDYAHPALRRGALVEVQHGPEVVWIGHVFEAGAGESREDGWTIRAQGTRRWGARRYAFDQLANTTTTPDVAITEAINRGLQWHLPTSISSVPFAEKDATKALNRVGDLLDAYCEQNSLRWYVDTDWGVRVAADPTTPTWYMTPGSGTVANADDEYASDVFVRYQEDALTYKTATARDQAAVNNWDVEEEGIDVTRRGLMTAGDAGDLAGSLITLGRSRMSWTRAVEPASRQLTRGGIAEDPPFVGPQVGRGAMLRLKGIEDPMTTNPWIDVVLGKAQYASGASTVPLSPVDLAPRNMRDLWEKQVTVWNPRSDGSAA